MASTSTISTSSPNFTSFFENWLTEKQAILQELESLLSQIDPSEFNKSQKCTEIIPKVLSHYQRFYTEKSKAASEDVCLILSPPWLTSFERSLLWVSGFKPSVLFHLLEKAVKIERFSDEKRRRVEAVKGETRRKERGITQAMARIQETVAEPPLYHLTRKYGKGLVDGEMIEFEEAMEVLKRGMLVVVTEADALRGSVAAEVVEILDGVEGVELLAAAARFELRAREWGLEKDSRNRRA